MYNQLKELNAAVAEIVSEGWFARTIDELKKENSRSQEPFVWSVIDLQTLNSTLPDNIKSAWIFVLKKDVPSGCHYHPNSVQHLVMIEGKGESNVGGINKRMPQFGSGDQSLEEIWYVIPEGVAHEFFPEEQDMVVISFHTCKALDLMEINCATEAYRSYEA